MIFFDQFLGEADKKDSVESAKYDINICSSSRTYSYWAFVHGFGFSGSDPDFLADPDPKHCLQIWKKALYKI